MSSFASVNGASVVGGSLLVPLVGVWTADLYLATDAPVQNPVIVVIGNLTLSGTVFRVQAYGGQTRVRLVGGAGGWRTEIGAQGYGSGAGVRLSTVLRDAAQACGETVNIAVDSTIGPAYARAADIASDILWQMVSQGIIPAWYVDTKGVTQTKAWPSPAVTSAFTVTDQKPDEGIAVIATEDYAAWLPGCTFTSPLVQGTLSNMGVHYVWGMSGDFRFEVMTGADNLTAAIDAIVQKQIAPTRFHGRYAYTVSNPSSSTVDATPVNQRIGLPSLQNVPLVGDSISSYTPPDGSTCHIMFLDGVPTQPICVWTAGNATQAQVLGGSTPVARKGDQVTISALSVVAPAGTAGGPCTISWATGAAPPGPANVTGTITAGSASVGCA